MLVENLYDYALLSEASYADLQNKLTPDDVKSALQRIGNSDSEPDDPDKGFSQTQAEEFIQKWEIVNHQPDTESGFSATLLRKWGQIYFRQDKIRMS